MGIKIFSFGILILLANNGNCQWKWSFQAESFHNLKVDFEKTLLAMMDIVSGEAVQEYADQRIMDALGIILAEMDGIAYKTNSGRNPGPNDHQDFIRPMDKGWSNLEKEMTDNIIPKLGGEKQKLMKEKVQKAKKTFVNFREMFRHAELGRQGPFKWQNPPI